MVGVLWEDGQIHTAEDWDALLEVVGGLPWNREQTDIREALVWRAYVLMGRIIDPAQPAEQLWRELESAGLVQIVEVRDER